MSKKRIEINEETSGVRLRASRTGGVNLSTAPAKGITLNTKHGARVSKTYNGLTLGFQNLDNVVRGRWNIGKTNINLSKSGLSVSNKNPLGTFNFTRPRSSSSTIGGIQVRGTNGAVIAFADMILNNGFVSCHPASTAPSGLAGSNCLERLFGHWITTNFSSDRHSQTITRQIQIRPPEQ